MRKFTYSERMSLLLQFALRYRSYATWPQLTESKKRFLQFKRIKQLINIAYYRTDFYKQKYLSAGVHPNDIQCLDDFKHLPTITKEELIEYNSDFIDKTLCRKKLILSRSSGSTGKFVDVYFDAQSFIKQQLQVIRMIKEFYPDYSPFDRELLVYTSEYPFSSIAGMYKVDYINNLVGIDRILEKIKSIRPKVISIYPSILREIIRSFSYNFRSLGIKAIITNSEYSTQQERDYFSEIFNCHVFDEYSSEELLSIAYQCRNKNYHITDNSCYLELLQINSDDEIGFGKVGEVVGTNLLNYAMPIIRYRQNDLAILDTRKCQCGNTSFVLKSFVGRKNDSFITKSGDEISSGKLLDWTYSLVLKNKLGIKEFELVQKSIFHVEVKLVVNGDFEKGKHDLVFVYEFERTFGKHFIFDIKLVDKIERTSSGKYNPIRSYSSSANFLFPQ